MASARSIAENVVRERETKLRDVLAVMGCDFRAYWLGTFLGDSILLAIAWVLGYWILGCVGCCCMLKKDKYEDDGVTCSNTGDACMCWFCEP